MTNETEYHSLDKDKILYFWLDHLEIYWTFLYEENLVWLDFENSNYITFLDFTITKHEVPKYEYKLTFVKNDLTLFAYYKWKKSGSVSTMDYICIYSTWFSLMTRKEIMFLLGEYFKLRKYKRLDICIDLKLWLDYLLTQFKSLDQKSTIFKGERWEMETYYIWEVKNSKNKRQLIRIYDKIKDSKAKNKHRQYSHYFTEDCVTRVEIEIRSELAKNIEKFEYIFDDTYLCSLFKNYIKKHTNLFDNLSDETITLYRPIPKFDPDKIHYWSKKAERKVKIFQGHAKNLMKIWYCPIELLISEWIISEKSKLWLWYESYKQFNERIQFGKDWFWDILPLLDH